MWQRPVIAAEQYQPTTPAQKKQLFTLKDSL